MFKKIIKFSIVPLIIFLLFAIPVTYRSVKQKSGLRPIIINKYKIEKGEWLDKALEKNKVISSDRLLIEKNLRKIFNTNRCREGDMYEITTDTSNAWVSFKYYPNGFEYYCVERSTSGAIHAEKIIKETKTETVNAKGEISTSLWESMTAQKIEPDVIIGFAEIFAWQIDFLTEPRKGDTYKLAWNRETTDDGTVKNRDILIAQYNASGTEHTAVLYKNSEGKSGYYSPKGESLFKMFLKAPLQYRRISSFFSKRRYHPILKTFRAHLGIDYAAPTGTPVSSIGDGTVFFASYSGGYGKLIKIRHANGYISQYGHLHGYAKGVRSGAHVSQGQVIGYVGSTGLSTGPHLDFRVSKDGSPINYLNLKIPPVKNIPKAEMPVFKDLVKKMYSELAASKAGK